VIRFSYTEGMIVLKQVALAYGDGDITVSLREEQILDIVTGRLVAPVKNVAQAVREAIQKPIGAPPLPDIVQKGDKIAIVVSDITRQWLRYDLFLPTLLDQLNQAGVADKDITLVVALGAHRCHSDEENVQMYGQTVVNRVQIVQSQAMKAEDFVFLGTTTRGTAIRIHSNVANADKVILTGGITYHPMAGFGGGRKAIMPGVSEYSSIQANHRLCLHAEPGKGINPNCTSGSLAQNEMNLDMLEIAERVRPAFLVNTVYTPDGEIARVFAGHWYTAWLEGCQAVADIYGVPVRGQADVTIVSAGGFPKDINFYQASKAIENACAAVRPGGVLIAAMECRDIADPPDFSCWFNYDSLYGREMALRQAFTVPGFVALKLGLVAGQIPVIVVTLPQNREFITRAGMLPAAGMEEALALAADILGTLDYRVTIIPHGANSIPVIK